MINCELQNSFSVRVLRNADKILLNFSYTRAVALRNVPTKPAPSTSFVIHKIKQTPFVFFGSGSFSVFVLDELKTANLIPSLLVTVPDAPKGRGLLIEPTPTKTWAKANAVPFLEPAKLDDIFASKLKNYGLNFFLIASYGKIIPKAVLDISSRGALNVHPSLLPKFRGASPVQSAILAGEEKTGVTIMLMDEKMDQGPILAQCGFSLSTGNPQSKFLPKASELEKTLAKMGGKLLAEVIPDWLAGKIKSVPQDEKRATYSKKTVKTDGLIDLAGNPYENYKKIRAFDAWPGTYFFTSHLGRKIRVIVKEAAWKDGQLQIIRVLPEGKKEMSYGDFLRGFA